MNCDTFAPDSKRIEERKGPICARGLHELVPDTPMSACLACVFDDVMTVPTELKRFGEYELLEEMGRGGMGVVYKARHIRAREHIVALKMIRNGELASADEVRRFYMEVEAASGSKRANIVPIYHFGEEDGRHYFTMELMTGGSVADHIDRYRGDSRGCAEFVAIIARAVHYAHQRGIIHRDLKPANILLDSEGKPYVADFGVAKRVDHHGGVTTYPGAVVGAPSYMAPEQADPRGKVLTTAADVYSLGVILYELLTGQCPFEGEDASEIIGKVLHAPAPDPRKIEPRVDLDLATLCLRCLEKDPANRYLSAEELTREIQRYLNDEPIAKVSKVKRVWRWCKRRPLMAALIVEIALLLVVATLAVFSGAAAQEKDRREEVLRANEYAARWVAGTVLFKLNSYHDVVAKAAREFPPEYFEVLRRGEVQQGNGLETYCKQVHAQHTALAGPSGLQDWFVVSKDGTVVASWAPFSKNYVLGNNFAWRDYFKGAWKLAEARSRSAYISRAILAEPTQRQRYVIAAPIYDENDEPIGVIISTTNTGAALGTLELKDPGDKRHIAMIVAPRDNNRDTRNDPLPEDYAILIHDSLASGTTATLKSNPTINRAIALAEKSNPNRGLEQLLLPAPNAVVSDENFCDPVMDGPCEDASGKTLPGRWLAGFAPIGNTGFVAIVETPREKATEPNQILAQTLLLWGVLPFTLGTAFLAGIVGVGRRRSLRAAIRRTGSPSIP